MHQRGLCGLGILAVVLASCPLPAQEWYYGGQITASWPGGDLGGRDWLHHRIGGGAGAHVLFAMEDGYALVPRLDYTLFEKNPVKVQMAQLGTDIDYFLSGRSNEGPYLGGGFDLKVARFELTGGGASARATPRAPGLSGIAGSIFTRHLGAELRWGWSKFKPSFTGSLPPDHPAHTIIGMQTLDTSFIFRF